MKNDDPTNSITVTPIPNASPSALCEYPADMMENNKNKRRIDDVATSSVTAIDVAVDIANTLEDSDLPCSALKKPKFNA